MYRIIQRLNGGFECEVSVQDGTERFTATTLEEAKTAVKRSAKILNGVKIKKKSIEVYREEIPQIARPILVRVNDAGGG